MSNGKKRQLNNDEIAQLRSKNGLPADSHPQSLMELFYKIYKYLNETHTVTMLTTDGSVARTALNIFSGCYKPSDLPELITLLVKDCSASGVFVTYVYKLLCAHPAYKNGNFSISRIGVGSTVQLHEALTKVDAMHKLSVKLGLPSVEGLTIAQAMNVIKREIQNDEGYRIGWQANIAMAFYDEARRSKLGGHNKIHPIANKAADNFLNLLVAQ